MRASLAVVALISAAALSALGRILLGEAPAAPVSVIMITLDTTRADRLSPYGPFCLVRFNHDKMGSFLCA